MTELEWRLIDRAVETVPEYVRLRWFADDKDPQKQMQKRILSVVERLEPG